MKKRKMAEGELPRMESTPDKLVEPILAPTEMWDMLAQVRKEHHEERLKGALLAVILVPGPEPKEGRLTSLGKAQKIGKLPRLVADADFIISINWATWQALSDEAQIAFLDHELCHCAPKFDKDGNRCGWQIRHHDIEEFHEILSRRGLWSSEWRQAGETLRQLGLFEKP